MQLHQRTMTGVLLALAILPVYVVSPLLVAGPQQEQRIEPAPNTTLAESVGSSTADSPAGNTIATHHPPGELAGSYTLNAPARPGFWVAAGFTGLIAAALIAALVLIRPGKVR